MAGPAETAQKYQEHWQSQVEGLPQKKKEKKEKKPYWFKQIVSITQPIRLCCC